MSTNEESRKAMAQARLHQEHLEQNILSRSQAEINQKLPQNIESEARESMVEQRQHQEHLKETMLSRTESELNQ